MFPWLVWNSWKSLCLSLLSTGIGDAWFYTWLTCGFGYKKPSECQTVLTRFHLEVVKAFRNKV